MPKITNLTARISARGRPPGLAVAAMGCAALLLAAPVLPPLVRLIVLPAFLFGPGWALACALDMTGTWSRSWSVVVPLTLVVTILISLALDVVGLSVDAATLGVSLGVFTALFVVLGKQHRPNPTLLNPPAAHHADGSRSGYVDGNSQ